MSEKVIHISADGHELKPGMEVWCNNVVLGNPPVRRRIGELVPGRSLIHYSKEDEDGYIGCKCSACWVDPGLAMVHALREDLIWNREKR